MSLLCTPLSAQDEDRIWGRVLTDSGAVHEGFIRWDRNEGSWVDVLDGSKQLPEENYLAWLSANHGDRAERVIELQGYRISWEEEHPDFPLTAASGIRFGHLASLEVTGRRSVELTLRSGQKVELEGGTTDLGPGLRRLIIDVPGEEEVRMRWRDLEQVTFSRAPAGVRATSRRLHGTVEDERGRRFTGYIAWDLDEILESDVLDGDDMGEGEDHEIPFRDIASIEKISRGSRVTLENGDTLDLTGTNDVDDDNSGIHISDPDLGMVEVEWEEFRVLRLHERDGSVGYDTFDGGGLLRGTVTTQDGEEIEGTIRWDADEASSWEFLNGQDDADFSIELDRVSSIERAEGFGAVVTLLDGRTFELFDSNDVDFDNKGVMIAPEDADHADADVWRMVSWDDFRAIRFRSGG